MLIYRYQFTIPLQSQRYLEKTYYTYFL